MSRSRKKNPFRGMTTVRSEKQDKQIANRRLRSANRQILRVTHDDTLLLHQFQFGQGWQFAKDGKRYFDPEEHPKSMRK